MGLGLAVKYFGSIFLLAATALLIVVSVSTPVWNSVHYLTADLGGQTLSFGNWGTCLDDLCTQARLGYDSNVLGALGVADTDNLFGNVSRGLSRALILVPISAGLSFLALLFAVFPFIVMGILGSVITVLAFLTTAASLGIALGLFVPARNRLNDQGLDAMLSNAIWLLVAALACQVIAMFTVCCGRRNKKDRRDSSSDLEDRPLTSQGRRGWFNRRNEPVAATNTYPPMQQKTHFWQRRQQPATTAPVVPQTAPAANY